MDNDLLARRLRLAGPPPGQFRPVGTPFRPDAPAPPPNNAQWRDEVAPTIPWDKPRRDDDRSLELDYDEPAVDLELQSPETHAVEEDTVALDEVHTLAPDVPGFAPPETELVEPSREAFAESELEPAAQPEVEAFAASAPAAGDSTKLEAVAEPDGVPWDRPADEPWELGLPDAGDYVAPTDVTWDTFGIVDEPAPHAVEPVRPAAPPIVVEAAEPVASGAEVVSQEALPGDDQALTAAATGATQPEAVSSELLVDVADPIVAVTAEPELLSPDRLPDDEPIVPEVAEPVSAEPETPVGLFDAMAPVSRTRTGSVFGDLFTAPSRQPLETVPEERSPVDWPPIPTGLFPPLPEALPKLNYEPAQNGDVAISWPEDPRAQTFWPQPEALVSETGSDQPTFASSDSFVMPELRPNPPALVFVDEPTLASEDADDSRRENSLFAPFSRHEPESEDFKPDRWSLKFAGSNGRIEEAVVEDGSAMQNAALTVASVILVVVAVMTLIYLLSDYLR
jgi:hypothetical protein